VVQASLFRNGIRTTGGPQFFWAEKINQLMSEAIMLSIDAKLAEAHEKSTRPQPNFFISACGYSMQGARRGRSGGCGGSG
jgi:hypothetical protein